MNIKAFMSIVACFIALGNISCNESDSGEKSKNQDPVNTFFDNERLPIEQSCFQGAYYRKAVSGKDVWLGIGGTVVLPEIIFDENRKNPNKPGQYLEAVIWEVKKQI